MTSSHGTHSDMKGIHPSITSHRLNVLPTARPIRQKRSGLPGLVGKCSGGTQKRRQMAGMLSFLDAFSGYHQIPMSPADEEKTAFITPHDLYCYKVMSFGLKNASTTYQRLMTKIFKPWSAAHRGKFLGFMVSQRGIEVNPDQVKESWKHHPQEQKGITAPQGKLVALGRFIARFANELRPFFLAYEKLERTDGQTASGQSGVLFRCPSPKEQKPIYYVSRALANVETRPNRKNASMGHRVKRIWIEFQPRLSMKGQVMADFVLEYSRRPIQHKEPSEKEWWTLRVDGAHDHQDPE
ncbi:Transposon Ty3-I Gag-Pol polyprotein [Vitis vinifera]|uniref:Transposon Ty3-I Gag-Pol polyprotein n=1 Tax=Vitis vinifera TaxID=29760 RepID=A0A438IVI7_VITVI|nr:Transposon Ty3-I Gag-Pol polyprotein [Vitis vinifera]